MAAPANPLRCPSCKEALMRARFWPWKVRLSIFLKCTLLLWIWGDFLLQKPDWYECPRCGRKRVPME